MARLYKNVVLPLIEAFTLGDAESAHKLAIWALRNAGQGDLEKHISTLLPRSRGLGTMVGDMYFPNPLGLAAGFDKDGTGARALELLDFGFIVSGTVVFHPQVGNPRPRLFRLPKDRGIINRYGFNSCGALQFAENIRIFGRPKVPLGISVGPNKDCVKPDAPVNEQVPAVLQNIISTIRVVYRCGDFFIINVSTPNTPGLRALQDPQAIELIASEVQKELRRLRVKYREVKKKPLWVKLAPDLTFNQIDETVGAIVDAGADGVIFGNTTTDKRGLNTHLVEQQGGFSGPKIFDHMCDAIRYIHYRFPGLPKIAVGGIDSLERANIALDCGANLIKIHTALVEEGPLLPSRITRGLWRRAYNSDYAEGPVEYKIAA